MRIAETTHPVETWITARMAHTFAVGHALTSVSLEDEFLEGLQIILDGIDRARQRR